MNRNFKLGRAIAQITPFYRHKRKEEKELISTKLLIIFGIVAIVKIAVLLLWI